MTLESIIHRLPAPIRQRIRKATCKPRHTPWPRGRVGQWWRLRPRLDLAASIVQITTNSDFSGSGTTFSPTAAFTSVAAGDAIVVWYTHDYSGSQPSLSCADTSSNTYSSAQDTCLDSADTQKMVVFFAVNCASGSNVTPTVTAGGAVPGRAIECAQITGCATAALGANEHKGQHQATPGTGTDGVTSTSVTPTGNSILLALSFNTDAAVGRPTAGTGFTSQATGWNIGGTDQMRIESKAITGSAAGTFTALGNNHHCTIAVAIADLGGGGPAPGRFFFAAGM